MSRPETERALILFAWDGLGLALPAERVLEMRQPRPEDAASVGDLLELAPAPSARGACRCLCIAGPAGALALRVQEPVRHCRLPAAALHPLPIALAKRLRFACLYAIARLDDPQGGLVLVLDADRLIARADVPDR